MKNIFAAFGVLLIFVLTPYEIRAERPTMLANSIQGVVWEDMNYNGLRDSGEPGIAGVLAEFFEDFNQDGLPDGAAVATKITTQTGGYIFNTGIILQYYVIRITMPSGMLPTLHVQGVGNSDTDPLTGFTGTLQVPEFTVNGVADAGFYRTGGLGNYVWHDLNHDGLQQMTEPAISGVPVQLFNDVDANGVPDGAAVGNTVTSAQGLFQFADLNPGIYLLGFGLPTGYLPTVINGTNLAENSDLLPGSTLSDTINLVSGEVDMSVDAGCFWIAKVGGVIWNDINRNGIKEAGEQPVPGMEVRLFADENQDGVADGSVLFAMNSSASGGYAFGQLPSGGYLISVEDPLWWVLTTQAGGDSQVNPATGWTLPFVLAPGEEVLDKDAGMYEVAECAGTVWYDIAFNGKQDPAEAGIAGVTVQLYTDTDVDGLPDTPGTPQAVTTTNTAGDFVFAEVIPGNYVIHVATPGNYIPTIQNAPAAGDLLDNDRDPQTGLMGPILLVGGIKELSFDAGFTLPATIGNWIWEDMDADGVQESGDVGIAGVTLELYEDANADGVADGPVFATTTSNATGFYQFVVPPGTYVLTAITPAGYEITIQNNMAGGNVGCSSIGEITGRTGPVSVAPAEIKLNVDAGFFRNANVGNFVWDDLDFDGIQDVNEPGIQGVNVFLYIDQDDDGVVENTIPVATTTSNSQGFYTFSGLRPHFYAIKFEAAAGYFPVVQGAQSVIYTNGFTADFLLTSNESDNTKDAGYYRKASVGGRVWIDSNANGVREANEADMEDVLVELYKDVNQDGIQDGPSLNSIFTTAAGTYQFTDLDPGNYLIHCVIPFEHYVTQRNNQNNNDAFDCDMNFNGWSNTITLTSGTMDFSNDAGFYKQAKMNHFVWEDINQNGIQDLGEPGMAGIPVYLYPDVNGDGTPDGAQLVSGNTNASGNIVFNGLIPYNYIVGLSVPFGYTPTAFRNPAATDETDSDILPNGWSPTIQLLSGVVNSTIDAGLFIIDTSTFVKGRVLSDADGDCLETPGEIGIPNRVVRVSNDLFTFYGWTSTDGTYRIAVQPGEFEVSLLSSATGSEICLNDQSVVLPLSGDSATVDFLEKLPACPQLDVHLSTPVLRRCFSNNIYWISYSNNSPVIAENAVITLVLDPFLNLIDAPVPFTISGNNTYSFSIGNVPPFTTQQFSIRFYVSCNAILNQTLCSEVHITPDTICRAPNPDWSGALLDLSSQCDSDSLRFTFENIGTGTMSEALEYIVIEDGIMSRMEVGNPLPAGGTMTVSVPANGSTWRVEARQEPLAPTASVPVLSVEGCTTASSFSTGFVTQFANNEAENTTDVDCTVVTGSYDPNDKNGIPTGYGEERALLPGTEIEYMIRFQNTGTDTAFTVVVRDTLSMWLDPCTIWPLAASHPYTFDLLGSGVGVFRFDNILLPDSNINEVASHGFVKFRIRPRAETPLGTNIYNQAAIYFDYNDPVLTNYTRHRIDSNFVTVDLWTPAQPQWQVRVMPNPASELTIVEVLGVPEQGHYRLQLYDVSGRVVRSLDADTPRFPLQGQELDQGVYWLDIRRDGALIGRGKLLVVK